MPLTQRSKLEPCIGRCTTTTGDYVCKGCLRSTHQVAEWRASTEMEKVKMIAVIDLYKKTFGDDAHAELTKVFEEEFNNE